MTDKPLSILLVDDDVDTRNVFKLVMDHYHMHLTVMEDAKSALEYLRSNAPDVVVMDIFLPDLDGYEALQQIRRNALVPDCPIIATTAYYTADTPKEITAWGFSGYLPKPLNAMKLVSYLREVVEASNESKPQI